jgi:Fusaric acid resistance protein-like
MIVLAFSTLGSMGFFVTTLLVANLFIIGNGFPTENTTIAIFNGLSFFVGGSSIYLILVFAAFFKHQKLNFYEIFKLSHFRPFLFSVILYAFQMIATILITYYISYYYKIPDGYWLPMTALLILKIDNIDSLKRMKHRFFRTIFGSLIAIPLCFVHDKYLLSLLMIPILLYIVLSSAKHYGSYVFFLTAMISILINMTSSEGVTAVFYRNLSTFLAVTFVGIILILTKFFDNFFYWKQRI